MKITSQATLLALLAAAAVLPGCNNGQVANAPEPPFSTEGIARSCTASTVDPAAGATATATIAVGNDGGWCALTVAETDGMPYATGLVRVRPQHGRIVIERSGNRTLVQYYPAPGYSGTDTFTAALRSRTASKPDLMVKVAVTVTRA